MLPAEVARRAAEVVMRLGEWRSAAPHKDAAAPKVAAVIDPVLSALGAGPDPHCWVAWGDEPVDRYSILVPTDPGLGPVEWHVPLNRPTGPAG